LKKIQPSKPGQKETSHAPKKKNARGVEYVDKLSALHEHASQLGLANTIDEITEHTLDAMKFALGFDWAGFFRVEDGYLKFIAIRGAPVAFSGLPLDGSGITVKAANTKSTIRVPDVRRDSAYVDGRSLDWKGPPTMLSELAVPVVVDDEVAAVLNAESSKLDAFTSEDQTLLEILAFHVGSALKRLVDVAERRRVEEALRENEEKYRRLFEEAMNGIALADPDTGILLDCNQALAALVGRNRAELIGQHQSILHPPSSDNSTFSPTFKLHATTHEGQVLETQVITAAGEIREVEIKASLLYLQERKMLQGIFSDITERKAAEEALRESESRYRALFDSASDAILIHDIGGKFLEANRVACERLGYSHEELLHMTPEDINSPEYAAHVAERVEDLRKRGHAFFEIAHMRRDGTVIPIELSSRIIEYKGKPAVLSIARDITERKRMEEALANERNILRTLIDTLPDNIFIKDVESRFVISNLAHVHDLRAKIPDEIVGKTDFDIFPRELAAGFYADEQAVIRSGQPLLNREERTIDPQGKMRWVLTTKVPLRDDHGKVIGVAGINRDITERKRMQQELERYSKHLEDLVAERTRRLRESELELRSTKERLEYVVASNPAVIYSGKPLADLSDWEMTYLGESVVAMLGYEPGEFIGHKDFWSSILHPEDRPSVLEQVRCLWNEGRFTFEYRMRHKNGGYRWIREEASLIRDTHGKPIEVNGYWTDITALKQAEQALLQSERKYRELFTAAREGILTYDENAVVTLVNPRLSEILSYAPHEMIDKDLFSFVYGPDVSMVRGKVERRRLGIAEEYETRLIRKDGARIYTNVATSPIMDENGCFRGGLVLLSDITERKRLEAELSEAQRLAAIGQTAAMVGHDLRNPLQATTSTLYLARKLLKSEKAEEKKEVVELLDMLDDQTSYMDKIVSDLQSYAAPVEVEPVETNLSNLIQDTVSSAKIPENIEITVVAPVDLARATVDPVLLKRVLTNLTINAVQAMPKGGKLVIECSKEDESLSVTVRDTGEGVAPENLEKIFNPFFTTKAKGQGLGLAVCKRLIEAQSGTIALKSELGKGSTFTVKIPMNRTPEAS
jgi:PAS domain S-box-containing protein